MPVAPAPRAPAPRAASRRRPAGARAAQATGGNAGEGQSEDGGRSRARRRGGAGSRACSPGRTQPSATGGVGVRPATPARFVQTTRASYVAAGDEVVRAWARGEEDAATAAARDAAENGTEASYSLDAHYELIRSKLDRRRRQERHAMNSYKASIDIEPLRRPPPAPREEKAAAEEEVGDDAGEADRNDASAAVVAPPPPPPPAPRGEEEAAAETAADPPPHDEEDEGRARAAAPKPATAPEDEDRGNNVRAAAPKPDGATAPSASRPPPARTTPPPLRKKSTAPPVQQQQLRRPPKNAAVPALLKRPSRNIALKRRAARRDRFLAPEKAEDASPTNPPRSGGGSKAEESDADVAERVIAELRLAQAQAAADPNGAPRRRRLDRLVAADDETVPEVMLACGVLTQAQERALLPAAKRYCRIHAVRLSGAAGGEGGAPRWQEVAARLQYRGAMDAKRHYDVGREALSLLVEHNLRLVVTVSRKYLASSSLSLPDLIVAGSAGITKAVEKFDISKGYKFSTYATWWIRQNVSRSVTSDGRLVRFPVHIHDTLHRVKRAAKQIEEERARRRQADSAAASVDGAAGLGRKDAPGAASVAGSFGSGDDDVFLADGSLNPAARYPTETMASGDGTMAMSSAVAPIASNDEGVSGSKSRSAWQGAAVTAADIAERTGIPEAKVAQVLKWNAPISSVDTPMDNGSMASFNLYSDDRYSIVDGHHDETYCDPTGDSAGGSAGTGILSDLSSLSGLTTTAQTLGSDKGNGSLSGKEYDPLLQTEAALHREKLDAALRSLTVRERNVLRMRWGLVVKGGRGMSYPEISDIYGLTKERIRQIEEKALRKLRQPAALVALRGEFKDPGGA